MASAPKQEEGGNVLSPEYMALLQSLCRLTRPTVNEVTGIFNSEFRRALGGGKAKPSKRSEAPSTSGGGPSTSRGGPSRGSKKRGGKSAPRGRGKGRGRKGAKGNDPDDDDGDGGDDGGNGGVDDDSYQRSCTWEPDQKPCWIIAQLDPWNRTLAKGFFELYEHKWGELTLQGYAWPDTSAPTLQEVLRVSLLIHLLLRQHRCVQRVVCDASINTVEPMVFWNAIKTHTGELDHFEWNCDDAHMRGQVPPAIATIWYRSLAALTSLRKLLLMRVLFDRETALTLGRYMEDTTALIHLTVDDVSVENDDAATFLDYLARNRSLKSIWLQRPLLVARAGDALADVVRKHPTLETVEVSGGGTANPSALLKAAVQSVSLRTLTVNTCFIAAPDVRAMAAALTRRPPSPATLRGATAAPPSPTSRLENLSFINCPKTGLPLQRAYANLIGGVLLSLTLTNCNLSDVFASAAAEKLLIDTRLRELYVQRNQFSINGRYNMLQALGVNTTLETLGVNFVFPADLGPLFDIIRQHDLSSRLVLGWINPDGDVFAEGHNLCRAASAYFDLDRRDPEDARILLDTLASSRQVNALTLYCTEFTIPSVIRYLPEALAKTKYLRELKLDVAVSEANAVSILRSLEDNRSVKRLFLSNMTFRRRAVRALGRMVEQNRTMNLLYIDLMDSGVDNWTQLRSVCRELKEAILRNRFLVVVNVAVGDDNRASDYVIKESLRRNMMLVNQAIRFVYGSMQKSDALAFETLQYSYSVHLTICENYRLDDKEAKEKVEDARNRLAANYFIFTGVVRRRVTCDQRGRTTLNDLDVDLLARICSYLSLTDVMDV
ncbi:uncharacterized protein [Dermacentor albipictus]|uniref:uncharacterized protein n=1 Tax=Dermacentor albipictus TaxID=60249 RepID=UPI0038FC27E4